MTIDYSSHCYCFNSIIDLKICARSSSWIFRNYSSCSAPIEKSVLKTNSSEKRIITIFRSNRRNYEQTRASIDQRFFEKGFKFERESLVQAFTEFRNHSPKIWSIPMKNSIEIIPKISRNVKFCNAHVEHVKKVVPPERLRTFRWI